MALSLCGAAAAFAQESDLSVSKTGPATAAADTDVSFNITLTNIGPDDAASTALHDAIVGGWTFVSFQQTSGPTFSCTTPSPGDNTGSVDCSLDPMPSGSTAAFTLVLHIPPQTAAGTQFTNVVTVSAPTDPNDENNSSTAVTSTPPPAQADIGIVKNGPSAAPPNTDVTYTLTFTNSGPSAADNVSLTDTLPGTMTFVSVNQSGGLNCTGTQTITCTSASYPAGASTVVTLVGHIPSGTPAGTEFTNTATVSSTTADPFEGNDTSTTTLFVSSSDVSVTKSGPATAITGAPVTYTITVANNGPDFALNVTLLDPLPGDSSFVSFNQNTGPAANCAAPPVGSTGTSVQCTFPVLAPSQSAQFTLVVNAGFTSPLLNTASVNSETADPNQNNNSSSVSTTVTTQVDVAVTKTVPATVANGAALQYTITVSNAGPSPAPNVALTDAIPAGTTFVSFVQQTGPTFTCTAPPVNCTIATLASGATATFALNLTVGQNVTPGTTISNTANVTSGGSDTNTANNTSTATTTTTAAPVDISVAKSGPASVGNGSNVQYTITVTNTSASTAFNVALSDATPANTTFGSIAQQSGPAFTCSGPPVSCTIATFAGGATATFFLNVTVNQATAPGTTITNTATVSSTSPDTNPNNNTSTTTSTTVASAVDVAITKTAAPGIYANGLPLTWNIVVTNNGPSTAFGVTVNDVLPASVTFGSATASQGSCSGTSTVTCTIGTLAAAASATITLTVTPNTPGSLSNTATVTTTSPDTVASNDSSTSTVTVLDAARIPALSPLLLALLAAGLALLALRR